MDLSNFQKIEQAQYVNRRELVRLGSAALFLVAIIIYVGTKMPGSFLLISAAVIGGYMALNIGANDVANNVGPAVGSKTMTLTGAIIIAAVFESSGAIIAGGDVVGTIRKGIIDPSAITDPNVFVWLMMAALLAGAVWLNLATALGMPVSTTHSIVGGVLGAGVAAAGWDIANWTKVGQIAASWVISPVLGGVIAACFLYTIKRTITYKTDMIESAKKIVPLLIGAMAWAFTTYLIMKGLKKLFKLDFITALGGGFVIAFLIYLIVRPLIAKAAEGLESNKASVNKLFVIPLICSAALLSFAHGANDVANAVGPLAAIYDVISHGAMAAKASIPLWVMVIGALGISVGLALFGPKLIRTVGSEITELDQARAFCIAMAAAITVIIASQLGLPVSSTHIAIGAIFGIGFLREAIKSNYGNMVVEIKSHHEGKDEAEVAAFLDKFETASFEEKGFMLKDLKKNREAPTVTKKERKSLAKEYKKELVKRSAVLKIVAAWVITVPLSGLLAAIIYFTIRGMLLP
ncbi:putative phosphate permease jhp_1384 [Candidatus Terasakiella magnetica]|uniref:Phosphate transporter n=1 Tax=Candidatus Terasakiella magnetica TaxID=1867952 RepID=A0A1C3RK62_9PROT|nr:inorganic phosphate transporter [Candidatus Terasakiella magnetica]SCA57627.1 putative phosphate permease jhp_1384 [Candidatus Terasakiella magnetica]